jgi:hypothetical protein
VPVAGSELPQAATPVRQLLLRAEATCGSLPVERSGAPERQPLPPIGDAPPHEHCQCQSGAVAVVPIVTDRLRIRALVDDDLAQVFAIFGDEATTARVSWRQPDIERCRA